MRMRSLPKFHQDFRVWRLQVSVNQLNLFLSSPWSPTFSCGDKEKVSTCGYVVLIRSHVNRWVDGISTIAAMDLARLAHVLPVNVPVTNALKRPRA